MGMTQPFAVTSDFSASTDQKRVVKEISARARADNTRVTLKGVTGSGKTFMMAKIIEQLQRPTLVLSHNKTLCAQLFREFRDFFPKNAVEYFVSYYDYYQPEAYVVSRDLYIEKDASINEEVERLRLSATMQLLERRDVVVIATVSCIYGLGRPEDYSAFRFEVEMGQRLRGDELSHTLINMQYERNDDVLERGRFRIRGDTIDIYPAYGESVVHIGLEWDTVAQIALQHPVTGTTEQKLTQCAIYPAKHFVTPRDRLLRAIINIKKEMEQRCAHLRQEQRIVEEQRLRSRTLYDIEMLEEMGYCSAIENYSRHIDGRKSGEPPCVLLNYFPENFLTFVDESHVTLPQLRGMYNGDRSRKETLVEHGFRLPSAKDNRPLQYAEFFERLNTVVFVSATPGDEEIEKSERVVEQVIRPTGLLDPEIEIQPSEGQIEHLYKNIRERIAVHERILITTLTKKMAEHLSDYLNGLGLKVRYLHSEIETFERAELLTDLRAGEYDVLVGINLLREGLDLPEVSLIGILDADKIGFLRSSRSLIQIIGRASRNKNGKVIMYADKISDAMETAIRETNRRREIQTEYNRVHNITPQTVQKQIQSILKREKQIKRDASSMDVAVLRQKYNVLQPGQRRSFITQLRRMMDEHVKNLEFEQAAVIRDELVEVNEIKRRR